MSFTCKCVYINKVAMGKHNGAGAEFQRCAFSLDSPRGALAPAMGVFMNGSPGL